MTRLFVALILAHLWTSSKAEWVKVETPDREFQLYADTAKINILGSNRIGMWDLKDFTVEQEISGARYVSEKSHREYDCKENRYRDLAWMWMSESMGKGDVVVSIIINGIPADWNSLKPSDKYYSLLRMACIGHDR